ncbi:hypothetical protein BB561_002964 [Smittium simulii]|uniref:Uncharacterized protein n=1 Tax=Smittium simulii TaxID=133385 RepID=A0A2T9YNI2_9FUNG|nr:hypothetical protein BB561_002964 [Smittium simulii]
MDQNSLIQTSDTGEKNPTLRLVKLQTTLDRSLSLVGEEFSYSKLQNLFPELAKELGDNFKAFYDNLYSLLIHSTQDDFSSIQIEYDIENKFINLDKLIVEAKNLAINGEKIEPRPSPEAEFSSRIYPMLERANQKIKEKINKQEQKNSELLALNEKKTAELDQKLKYLLSIYHSVITHQKNL